MAEANLLPPSQTETTVMRNVQRELTRCSTCLPIDGSVGRSLLFNGQSTHGSQSVCFSHHKTINRRHRPEFSAVSDVRRVVRVAAST
eukprot:6286487-Alexandrium_andersonii.AAC.1